MIALSAFYIVRVRKRGVDSILEVKLDIALPSPAPSPKHPVGTFLSKYRGNVALNKIIWFTGCFRKMQTKKT